MKSLFLEKIISGGQTGADRAALEWAIAHNLEHGGWCPKGRRAEDGEIAPVYNLRETPSTDYAERTEWNIRDSDATVIFSSKRRLKGGSALTARLARSMNKPLLHLHAGMGVDTASRRFTAFLQAYEVKKLNIAGPRSSKDPEVFDFVQTVLNRAFEDE